MTATYVGNTPGTAVVSTSITVTRSHSAGNASIFVVHTDGVLTSVTFDGSPMTPAVKSTSSDRHIYIYAALEVTAGNHTWVANQASASIMASITEVSGAHSFLAGPTFTSAGATAWTMTVNPLATTELLIGGDSWEYGHSTHGTDYGTQVENYTFNGDLGYGLAYAQGNNGSTVVGMHSNGATPVDAASIILSVLSRNYPKVIVA